MKIKSIKVAYDLQGRFAEERGDCTVRAWAKAFDIPYAEAHAQLKADGRIDRKGYVFHRSMIKRHPGIKPITPRMTIGRFLAEGPGAFGTWIIRIRGHVFTSINGANVSDWGQFPAGSRIQCAWKIETDVNLTQPIIIKGYTLVVNGRESFTYDSLSKAESMKKALEMLKNQVEIKETV